MRLRNHHKRIKKANLITSIIDSPSVTAVAAVITTLETTTGTIVTLAGTTAGIDTVNASKAMNVSGTLTAKNATINAFLTLPTSEPIAAAALTGGNYYGAFYFTGLTLFIAKSGTWISGVLAN